jgi:hypothetical protein
MHHAFSNAGAAVTPGEDRELLEHDFLTLTRD